jgi:cobalt-zinc-cadmium efflux system membrane fusion protein
LSYHLPRSPRAALPTIAIVSGALLLALAAGIALDHYLLKPSPAAPAAEETEAAAHDLKIDDTRIRNADIRVEAIVSGTLANQIIAQATVAATPDGAAIIGARADGTVTSIRKRLGDAVAQGESLGVIQSREAARLAEEVASAQARQVRAEQAFQRQKNLLGAGATSRQEYDAAQAEWQVAQAELARARMASAASGAGRDGVSLNILSPVAGRVTAAPAVLGSYVVAGTELFRVADPSKLEVQAAVPSADAQRVAVGDRAIIDLPQGPVEASVRAITPDINLESRAATVVLTPHGGLGALQPGQLVSARIIVGHGHSDAATVLVPTEAMQRIGGNAAVFLRVPSGFHVQPVTPGAESGGMTEVRGGLKPGDIIATGNAFLLKAELQKGSGDDDD